MTILTNEPLFGGHAWPPPSPRASLVHSGSSTLGRLWMGGAHARDGAIVSREDLGRALVVDCAGDLADDHRAGARAWLSCVFADLEVFPTQISRIRDTAQAVARHLTGAPERPVYVLCQYGMNRSGLITGLVLRDLGLAADQAIDLIRAARPGALSNLTFLQLIQTYQPAGPLARS